MHRHLVAVEVRVEGLADERMQVDSLALDEHGLERLDGKAVERRCAVEQHEAAVDDLFEDVPHEAGVAVDGALGTLNVLDLPSSTRRFMTKGLKSSSAMVLGRPHWCSLSLGSVTMTERPE